MGSLKPKTRREILVDACNSYSEQLILTEIEIEYLEKNKTALFSSENEAIKKALGVLRLKKENTSILVEIAYNKLRKEMK